MTKSRLVNATRGEQSNGIRAGSSFRRCQTGTEGFAWVRVSPFRVPLGAGC